MLSRFTKISASKYQLETTTALPNQKFNAIVLGVKQKDFVSLDFASLQKENSVLYDEKGILGTKAKGGL